MRPTRTSETGATVEQPGRDYPVPEVFFGMPRRLRLSIADDVLGALSALHEQGLVRRCLRPNEIFVKESHGRLRAVIGGYGPLMMLQGLQNA